MKKAIFSLIIFAALFDIVSGQTPFELDKVRSIKVMESSRDDVRKIFAGYKFEEVEPDAHYDRFTVEDAEIQFDYSRGGCDKAFEPFGFAAPEWKVTGIFITPKETINLKESGINLKGLRKERLYVDKPDSYAYYDKKSGIIIRSDEGELVNVEFILPKKYYGLLCDKEVAKKLTSTQSIFEVDLKERYSATICPLPNVTDVILSRVEIIADCVDSDKEKECLKNIKTTDVFTTAANPQNDALVYAYTITAGKIIGTGAKVVWDLTGIKPGTYTITAAVDDGCGFCGATMTKTVVVKECVKCR